jgi:hypothetical protein
MREMIPHKTPFEAWEFACTTPKWSINWPCLSNFVEESCDHVVVRALDSRPKVVLVV